MKDRDPYEILKIASNTESEVIEAVYRMVLARHRKSGTSSPEALEQLELAQWAYELLRDPKTRREYDNVNPRQQVELQEHPVRDKKAPLIKAPLNIAVRRTRNLSSTVFSFSVFGLMLAAVGAGLYFVGAVPWLESSGNTGEKEESTELAPSPIATIAEETSVDHMKTATVAYLSKLSAESSLTANAVMASSTVNVVLHNATATEGKVGGCPSVSSINIRTGPGADYPAVGFILDSDCVTFIGRNDENTWAKVGEADKDVVKGHWVALSVMTVSGSTNSLPVLESDGPPPSSPEPTGTVMPTGSDGQDVSDVVPTP